MSGFLAGSELLMRGASGHFVMLHEVDFIFHDVNSCGPPKGVANESLKELHFNYFVSILKVFNGGNGSYIQGIVCSSILLCMEDIQAA